jgi:hypothetical protein
MFIFMLQKSVIITEVQITTMLKIISLFPNGNSAYKSCLSCLMTIPVAGELPNSNREYLQAVCHLIFNIGGDLRMSL